MSRGKMAESFSPDIFFEHWPGQLIFFFFSFFLIMKISELSYKKKNIVDMNLQYQVSTHQKCVHF